MQKKELMKYPPAEFRVFQYLKIGCESVVFFYNDCLVYKDLDHWPRSTTVDGKQYWLLSEDLFKALANMLMNTAMLEIGMEHGL